MPMNPCGCWLNYSAITFFGVVLSKGESTHSFFQRPIKKTDLQSWTSSAWAVEIAAWPKQFREFIGKDPGLRRVQGHVFASDPDSSVWERAGGELTTHFDFWVFVFALCVRICPGSTWTIKLISFSDFWWKILMCAWCTCMCGFCWHGTARVTVPFSFRGQTFSKLSGPPLLFAEQLNQDGAEVASHATFTTQQNSHTCILGQSEAVGGCGRVCSMMSHRTRGRRVTNFFCCCSIYVFWNTQQVQTNPMLSQVH